MRRKADAASATARRWFVITLVAGARADRRRRGSGFSLSNAILGPVHELTDADDERSQMETWTSAVPVRSADEIGALAGGFNRMAERIRELRRSDLGQLLVAQQTTEAAIDSLYDPVIVTDSSGRVTRINPAAERLFGPRDEAAGKPIDDVARDVAHRAGGDRRPALRAGRGFRKRRRVLPWAVDGSPRAFRVRSTPMRDVDDRLVGAVTLLEDITHLSEISRLKSEFIAAASHELRTPLTSLQMGIHLLLEGTAGTLESAAEILEVCRDDAGRLDQLMRAVARSVQDRVGRERAVRSPLTASAPCPRGDRIAGSPGRGDAVFGSSSTCRRISRRFSPTAHQIERVSSTW